MLCTHFVDSLQQQCSVTPPQQRSAAAATCGGWWLLRTARIVRFDGTQVVLADCRLLPSPTAIRYLTRHSLSNLVASSLPRAHRDRFCHRSWYLDSAL